jgi:PcfJ-like protein
VNGFRFFAAGPRLTIASPRRSIRVTIEPWAFVVKPAAIDESFRFDLAEIQALSHFLLWALGPRTHLDAAVARRRDARGADRGRVPRPPGQAPLPPTLVQGHLLDLRNRGLAELNPRLHAVQRPLLEVARLVPPLAFERLLWREEMVVRDLLQYRAAAIALVWLESDLWRPFASVRLPASADASRPSIAALVAAMTEWRGLLSPDGRPYRSLNRTLMNLPAAVPSELVPFLSRVRLERPITSQIVLTALLLHARARRTGFDPDVERAQQRLLQHATEREIADALARLGARVRRQLSARRVRDLAFAMEFIRDYPDSFGGRLDGLMRRAIDWHACVDVVMAGTRETDRETDRAPRRAPVRVARPPIPPPRDPRIEFLDTVERIALEGVRMHHCIGSYSASALAGECYLFHVSIDGTHASVEVDRTGRVRQAEGPCNVHNGAAAWGRERLGRWGARLREALGGDRPPLRAWAAPLERRQHLRGRRADPRQLALWPDLA